MSTAGDSADHLMQLYLDGVEVGFKIVGEGAKNIAMIITAKMAENKQTKGKTRLATMLKTNKELKIYTFKAEDMKKFSQEAKKYGVLYCVLANKKNSKIDGLVDILVKDEDASKVNRIAERFEFAKIDKALIAKDINEQEKAKQVTNEITDEEKLVNDILSNPEEEIQEVMQENSPSKENTEEKNQLESSLSTKHKNKSKTNEENKPSVKQELAEITKEVESREKAKENIKEENVIKEKKKEPKHYKEEKQQPKPKHLKEPKHLNNAPKRKKLKRKER